MEHNYAAENLPEFMGVIRDIQRKWAPEEKHVDLWYRGLQKSHWTLVPKLYRYLNKNDDVNEEESDIREDFIRRAPSLTTYKPENEWEWYFLMQHYGAPTRLLDWTGNPLLGLYFAVRDNQGLHDAAVWILDPWQLNKRVLGKAEVLPPGSPGLAREDVKRYEPWLPRRFDTKRRLRKELPAAIFPNHFDRRIAAQGSGFTIHGLERRGLEEAFGDRLAKVVIPSFATQDLKEQLDV